MGFFSDLKEDLSQAVNELMPEEALEAALADSAQGQDMLSNKQLTNETLTAKETPSTVDSLDLSSMLDKLEEIDTAEEPLEEEIISPDIAAAEVTQAQPWMAAQPEQVSVPEVMAEPEIAVEEEVPAKEPVQVSVPEVEAAKEPAPEAEPESDNTISEISGEEEKNMDVQTQEQVQAPVNRVAVDETAVVTEGMTITGDIVSEGSMELIGTVNGNLDIYGKLNITGNIQGDSKAAEIYAEGAKITGEVNSQGSVKIGQSSVVIGNILASSAVIAGAVKGDIDVHGPVILDTTAIVMGNIKSKSVQINNGAVIEGLCSQCYADVSPSSFFEEFKKKKQ